MAKKQLSKHSQNKWVILALLAIAQFMVVLDIAIEKNLAALKDHLAAGTQVTWFDHHVSPEIPASNLLTTHINIADNVNTSWLVNLHLQGAYAHWALVALYGDDMAKAAGERAQALGLDAATQAAYQELGVLFNYNAYGESLDDLWFHPSVLLDSLTGFADPLSYLQQSEIFSQLRQGYAADMKEAQTAERLSETLVIFPAQAWARRVIGVYANELAGQHPSKAVAILVENSSGSYTVSVRAPKQGNASAAEFCSGFPTGGGRVKAAGINQLPKSALDDFQARFTQFFG